MLLSGVCYAASEATAQALLAHCCQCRPTADLLALAICFAVIELDLLPMT